MRCVYDDMTKFWVEPEWRLRRDPDDVFKWYTSVNEGAGSFMAN